MPGAGDDRLPLPVRSYGGPSHFKRQEATVQRIRTNLWFDTQAEDAARFYCSVFKNSRIIDVTNYPAAGQEIHGKPPGSVMTVEFELDGHPFIALNGGPDFTFNEAI